MLHGFRKGSAQDDVGNGQTPTRLEHSECLAEHCGFVGGQVHDAVGDDHIHRLVGQWDGLDGALEELGVGHTGLGLVSPGEGQHLGRHVQAICLACRSDSSSRQEHVNPPTGAEVEDDLARMQFGEQRGVPAAERRGERGIGQCFGVVLPIQRSADETSGCAGRAAARCADRSRCLGIVLTHRRSDLLCTLFGHVNLLIPLGLPHSSCRPVVRGRRGVVSCLAHTAADHARRWLDNHGAVDHCGAGEPVG